MIYRIACSISYTVYEWGITLGENIQGVDTSANLRNCEQVLFKKRFLKLSLSSLRLPRNIGILSIQDISPTNTDFYNTYCVSINFDCNAIFFYFYLHK